MKGLFTWLRNQRLKRLRKTMLLHETKFNTYDSIERAIHFIETGDFDPVKFPNAPSSYHNDTYL